jgi:hypothetical protein
MLDKGSLLCMKKDIYHLGRSSIIIDYYFSIVNTTCDITPSKVNA